MDDGFLSSLEEKIAQQEAAGAPRFKLVRFKDITVTTFPPEDKLLTVKEK